MSVEDLRCVNPILENVKAGEDGVETGRRTLKHAIRNHLFLVRSKRLQKGCSRNQAQAARKAGVILGVGGPKENTFVFHDIFEEYPVSEGGLSDFVVSEDCEIMPVA